MAHREPSSSDASGSVERIEPLPVERLTWAVLLGRWVDFAQAAVALPTDAEGRRWRAVVPDVIQLQAVWFALERWDELPEAERALALDRAALLVARHGGQLRAGWQSTRGEGDEKDSLPDSLRELIDDAEAAVARCRRVWEAAHDGQRDGDPAAL